MPTDQTPRNIHNFGYKFIKPYERLFNKNIEEGYSQNGFISSTTYAIGDLVYYKAQTVYSPLNLGPIQDTKISNSREVRKAHLLKELREIIKNNTRNISTL